MTANQSNCVGHTDACSYPAHLAMLWTALGGDLVVSAEGRRMAGRPDTVDQVPDVPLLRRHEQPMNAEQWDGAMRMLDALLHNLCEPARAQIFASPFAQRLSGGAA